MTLRDFANDRSNVVIYFAGVGQPNGDYTIAGNPDFDYAERRGLLDLEGAVNSHGTWQWNGEGNPLDDHGNTIYSVFGFVDSVKYARIENE